MIDLKNKKCAVFFGIRYASFVRISTSRAYNGSYIDHLIYKLVRQLSSSGHTSMANDHLLDSYDVPDLYNKISDLHYIEALNTDALGQVDKKEFAGRVATFFGTE